MHKNIVASRFHVIYENSIFMHENEISLHENKVSINKTGISMHENGHFAQIVIWMRNPFTK